MTKLIALTVVLAAAAASTPATATAKSPFAWRGIVEGAYGPTWSHAQRTKIVRWMPKHGFNAYVHAPKDDLYQRTNWRDPYPRQEQREFSKEVKQAKRSGVDWIPNLSPAQPLIPTPAVPNTLPSRDLCFSCDADLQVIRAKLKPFVEAGSRTVMISFDDVSKVMTNPEDLAKYGTGDEAFGKANGDFLTRLKDSYHGRIQVLTVGADYSGTADTAYLKGLRSTLAKGIEVMWTGASIPSEPFTPEQAREYGKAIDRTPLVWDNWTDNDTAGNATPHGAARIFLGPYRRSAKVAGSVRGFFFNPMNEAGLNELPLATAGAWMRAPRHYRARKQWLKAIRALAGRSKAQRERLRAWAETSWSNKLDRDRDAPTFARLSKAFLASYDRKGWRSKEKSLARELRLAGQPLPRSFFIEQAGPWVQAARSASKAGGLGTRLLEAERPSLTLKPTKHGGFRGHAAPPDPSKASTTRDQYAAASRTWQTSDRFVYGWRGGLAFEIPPYEVPDNLMDTYLDQVDARDQAWQPNAEQAASQVRVTLNGQPVPTSFHLPHSACNKILTATDGAGGRTSRKIRCRFRGRPFV